MYSRSGGTCRRHILKEIKKVHFTHFHKKIKSCHKNYKKTLTCTFLSSLNPSDIAKRLLYICYQGQEGFKEIILKEPKKYMLHIFIKK